MYVVFHSNFAAYIVYRRCKACEFLWFVWTDCWGNKSYHIITSPANRSYHPRCKNDWVNYVGVCGEGENWPQKYGIKDLYFGHKPRFDFNRFSFTWCWNTHGISQFSLSLIPKLYCFLSKGFCWKKVSPIVVDYSYNQWYLIHAFRDYIKHHSLVIDRI